MNREYSPMLTSMRDMAHFMLGERYRLHVDKNWAIALVMNQPRLSAKQTECYGYRKAKCENPDVIQG